MSGEKTEKATPKRKQDERKKGNVFLSKEIVTVASLIGLFYSLKLFMPSVMDSSLGFIHQYINKAEVVTEIDVIDVTRLFIEGCLFFAKTALPLLLISVLINIVFTMAQTKMLFSTKAFKFKFEHIDPIKGIKKMFSLRSFVELIKSILKIVILAALVYSILQDKLYVLPRLMHMDFIQAVNFVGDTIMSIVLRVGILFSFLAIADYIYQWWQYEKNLRMSKQEIKDEYKQIEGDPQVKAHIRQVQQQNARKRMMQQVPTADVIIRNPTHYAVAIKYDGEKNRAPIVVAKGADSLALRIIAKGEESGVYIMENRPLAQALYKNVDIDREVPQEFYQAIAEILAFVYGIKNKGN